MVLLQGQVPLLRIKQTLLYISNNTNRIFIDFYTNSVTCIIYFQCNNIHAYLITHYIQNLFILYNSGVTG